MTDFNKMAEGLIAGDRRALSRAITLVEVHEKIIENRYFSY